MKRIALLVVVLVTLIFACQKKPSDNYPIEPQIYYKGVNPNILEAKDTAAFIQIIMEFNDGDGDLGTKDQPGENRIYVKDSRDTSAGDSTFVYPFPFISDNMRAENGSLQGSIFLNLGLEYFSIIPIDSFHLATGMDTLTYNIYIKDDKGHKSNVITTDTIYVKYK